METKKTFEERQQEALPKLMAFIEGYIGFMSKKKGDQERQFFNTNSPARKVRYAWNKWLSWKRNDFAGFFNNLDHSHQDCVLDMLDIKLEDEIEDRMLFTTFLRMAWNTNPGTIFKGISNIKGFKNYGDAKNWGILMIHFNKTQPELAESVCYRRFS